jgi:hypothetical protein
MKKRNEHRIQPDEMVPVLVGPSELMHAYLDRRQVILDGELVGIKSFTYELTADFWRIYRFTLTNHRVVTFRNQSLEDEMAAREEEEKGNV